jgi:hypothetical protein
MMKCYQQGARGANARVVQPEMFSRCVQPSQFNSPRIPQFLSAYLLIEGNVRSERTFCGDMCSARPLVVARLLARVPCRSLTSVVCLLVCVPGTRTSRALMRARVGSQQARQTARLMYGMLVRREQQRQRQLRFLNPHQRRTELSGESVGIDWLHEKRPAVCM